MNQEEIIKEFRKKFPGIKNSAIINFWLSKLDQHNQDLLKKIEDFKMDIFGMVGENKDIDRALPIIKWIFSQLKQRVKKH